MHCKVSGVCHRAFDNDIQAISSTKIFLNYLPENCLEQRQNKVWSNKDKQNQSNGNILNSIIPVDPKKPYDMKLIIENVCDGNKFFEIMPDYAQNLIIGFGEIEG